MGEKEIVCVQCKKSCRAEWLDEENGSIYRFPCPYCNSPLKVYGAPPILIYSKNSDGEWDLVDTLGLSEK